MTTANPKAAWDVVEALQSCLRDGSHGLSTIPGLIVKIIKDDLWREFYCEPLRETMRFMAFPEYVADPLPSGLGTDVRTLKNLCRDHAEALDAIDQACQNEPCKHIAVDNIHGRTRPTGTSRDAALRRLRKDRPDLHAQVLANTISANAAMVQAGYRKKLSHAEQCVRAFKKAENRLDPLREILGELKAHEREIVKEWLTT